jgi:hypothetical protein
MWRQKRAIRNFTAVTCTVPSARLGLSSGLALHKTSDYTREKERKKKRTQPDVQPQPIRALGPSRQSFELLAQQEHSDDAGR